MIDTYDKMSLRLFFDVEDIAQSDMDLLDKEVNLIALLSGKSPDDILALPLQEFSNMTSSLQFITGMPNRVIPKTKYTLNGRVYEVMYDAEKMNVAQYVDYSSYCNMEDEREKLIGMLSVFMIPKGKKYGEGYDIKVVKEDILDMIVTEVWSMSAFFLDWLKALTKATQTYLVKKLKKTMKKEKDMEKKMMLQEAITNLEQSGAMLQ